MLVEEMLRGVFDGMAGNQVELQTDAEGAVVAEGEVPPAEDAGRAVGAVFVCDARAGLCGRRRRRREGIGRRCRRRRERCGRRRRERRRCGHRS